MASILKRKRVQTEVADLPKRSKSTSESAETSTKFGQSNGGFDIFEALGKGKELAQVNGAHAKDELESTEVIDFEDLFEDLPLQSTDSQAKRGMRPKKEIWEKKIPQAPKPVKDQSWNISEPVGGRMIDADPIFTEDEKYDIGFSLRRAQLLTETKVHDLSNPNEPPHLLNLRFTPHPNHKIRPLETSFRSCCCI